METKEELKKSFSKDYKKYYEVELFRSEGFERMQCEKCNRPFWSTSKGVCGDSSCEPYTFFNNTEEKDYISIWKDFEKFFVDNGHIATPRYPVICRWRDDLYFTIASIVDFMRLEQGNVVWEYPSNPLVVPQMCLRFNDIPNVGVTGRHFSCFIMAGQHAFNIPKEGYWKDKCIELNYEYLTKVLGIKKDKLTYIEDLWAMPDLSSFGPCIETFAGGLEIVNSVFTEFTKAGEQIKELDSKVIDVGWGFERIVWYANGTPTAYDSAFGPVTKELIKKSGIIYDKDLFLQYAKISGALDISERTNIKNVRKEVANSLSIELKELNDKIAPLEAIYAILDHARCLTFALADGGLPSNVGGGYNLRVILRRALSFIDEYSLPFDLFSVMQMHASYLRPLFPELNENIAEMQQIVEVEEKRYKETLEKAKRIVKDTISKKKLTTKEFAKLYESHGVTPEIVEEVAKKEKLDVEVPTDFYQHITQEHLFAKKEEKPKLTASNLPDTKLLYYETDDEECTSKILDIQDENIILDQTIFYPEGGGQIFDLGEIGDKLVTNVQKVGGVVFHMINSTTGLEKGQTVKCKVDKLRRKALRRHHSSTHILVAVCRLVLGNHVWQHGAKKEKEKAHLDITHYEKLTKEQLVKIEEIANKMVLQDKKVSINYINRKEAEAKFTFLIYQGGGSPGKNLRIVDIEGVDVEACGGLHVKRTSEIGIIKIIKEERIQDGVNRIEFCAGEEALNHVRGQEELLDKISNIMKVGTEQIPTAVERFFNEWKERGKKIDELSDNLALLISDKIAKENELVKAIIDIDVETLKKIAINCSNVEGCAVILANESKDLVCGAHKNAKYKANELLKDICTKFNGNGGGNEKLAIGKTKNKVAFK